MIVIDSSAVLELLLGSQRGTWVREAIAGAGERAEELHGPGYLDVEVAQVLRRMEAAGAVNPDRSSSALQHLERLPLRRHLVTPLLPRIWSHRHNLTSYDAGYAALAEALDCPLLTFDERLARAPGISAPVIVPGPA